MVPKRGGKECRWIMDLSELNKMTTIKWPTRLCPVRLLVSKILKANWVGELDGVSYFHQFPLPLSLQPYFGFNLGCRRFVQTTLPMGWVNAMAVACLVSDILTWGIGLFYCDNLFPTGESEFECAERLGMVEARAHQVGIEVSLVQSPTRHPKLLGLELDLEAKRYRLRADWLDEVKQGWNVRARPRRRWAVLVGQLIYGVYIMGMPLGLLHQTLSWVSTLKSSWATQLTIPKDVVSEMKSVFALLLANPWTYVDTTDAPATSLISADASPTGGAASLLTPTRHMRWSWTWSVEIDHQIHREAWATVIGLALASPHLPMGSVNVVSDCVPWMSILTSGYSLSHKLQELANLCWKLLDGRHFTTIPVCSKHHWDDGPSRLPDLDLPEGSSWLNDVHDVFPSPPPLRLLTVHQCSCVCSASSLLLMFSSMCRGSAPCAFCLEIAPRVPA